MTTIAYRAGVLAADSSCWEGSTHVHPIKKIFRVRSVIIGCAGYVTDIKAFVRWIENGADEAEFPRMDEFAALVISDDGKVRSFEQVSPDPIPVLGAYCAIGQGSDVALGAMWAGATAVQAVKAAKAHNGGTCGRIQTLKIRSPKFATKKRTNGVKDGPLDGPRDCSQAKESIA